MIPIQKSQKTKAKTLPKNILEALRDLGNGFPADAQDQLGLRPRRIQESRDRQEFPYPFEGQIQPNLELRRQEKVVFSAKDQEIKNKVGVLQDEAKKLASAVQNLNKEVFKTSFEAPATPGIYHENFFEKLISFVRSLTKKIDHASNWLATSNSRNKKRPYYWSQVGKSGAKFMLSQERYMATQTG